MCQSTANGGKRCLRHSAVSNAEVRFTWAKTGVDKETIYGILKDLNKEGRKLDAPELEEVKEFIRKEEFKVKLDPDLNDRDRKLILKNLKKAVEEAEKQGVTGGAFHAWKNLFSTTVTKIKKPLAALGLAGVLVATLAGCGGGGNQIPTTTHTPKPTKTSTATADLCDPANDIYGDSEAYKTVTDSLGTYCQTQIDPKAKAMQKDLSKYDLPALKAGGISTDQAFTIQKKAVEFFAKYGLDSSLLDTNTQGVAGNDPNAMAWVKKHSNLIDPAVLSDYTKSGSMLSGQIVVNGFPPPLIRDGKSRIDNSSIVVTKVSYADSNSAINVYITAKTTYRASDQSTVKWMLNNKDGGKTQAQAKTIALAQKKEFPQLYDNKGVNDIVLSGDFAFAYDPKSELITGNTFNYGMNYVPVAKK